MKTAWLDRSLILGPYVTLVLSEKGFQAAMKHCQIPKADRGDWLKTPHASATVHTFTNPAGEMCCIVALALKPKTNPTLIVGTLVHESVHIWQHFRERIGEDNPGREFEAYAIQSISQQLIGSYSLQTAKKKK